VKTALRSLVEVLADPSTAADLGLMGMPVTEQRKTHPLDQTHATVIVLKID
jgi:hypothetical protein